MATKNAFNWARVCPLPSYGTVYNLFELCRGATMAMPIGESNSKLSWQKVDGRSPSTTNPINTHVQGGIVCEMKVASHAMDDKNIILLPNISRGVTATNHCLPQNGRALLLGEGSKSVKSHFALKLVVAPLWPLGRNILVQQGLSSVHSIPPCVLLDIEGSQDSDNGEISSGFVKCFKFQFPTCYANKTSVMRIPTIPTRRAFTNLSCMFHPFGHWMGFACLYLVIHMWNAYEVEAYIHATTYMGSFTNHYTEMQR